MGSTRRMLRPLAGALLLTAITAAPALAAPGDLDPAFHGGQPIVFSTDDMGFDNLNRLALAPDGKIVAAGCGCRSRQSEMPQALIINRWNADGSHDDAFGGAGGVVDDELGGEFQPWFGPISLWPSALAVGADNRVYAAVPGMQRPPARPVTARIAQDEAGDDLIVARYGTTGTREQVSRVDIPGVDAFSTPGLLPLADGKVLAAGSGQHDGPHGWYGTGAIVRLGADGLPDPTFAGGGILLPDFTDATDETIVGLGRQPGAPAGTFVVAGVATEGEDAWIFVARFTAGGELDPTFGTNGITTQPVASDNWWYFGETSKLAAFTIGGDGAVYVSEPGDFALRRFTAAGQPDTSFGTGGLARLAREGSTWSSIVGLGVQPDGKVVAVGPFVDEDGLRRDVIARFTPNGTLDSSYAEGGSRELKLVEPPLLQVVNDLVMQPDGKPVVGGARSTAASGEVDERRLTPRATAPNGTESAWILARVDAESFATPQPQPQPQAQPEPLPQQQPPAPQQQIGPAPVTAAGGKRVCVSRRSFRIRLRIPRHAKAVSATVRVNGKRVQVIRGKRLRAPVNLKGLPKGRFKVDISVRLRGGKVLTGQRAYRTCTPKRTSTHTIKL